MSELIYTQGSFFVEHQLTSSADLTETVRNSSADLKRAADDGHQLTKSISADPATSTPNNTFRVHKSELITFMEKHEERLWPNPKTRQNTTARIRRFDEFSNHSELRVSEITVLHIYDWLDDERQRGLAGSSINRYGASMSSILGFAVEAKLRSDPVKLRYEKEFARKRYMTDTEIDSLIGFFVDSGDQWMADMCYVAVNTGMRLSEILSLGKVRSGILYSHNKEAQVQDDCVYLPASITKTSQERYVSINPRVRSACLRLVDSITENFTHRKFYDRWEAARMDIAPNDKEFVFHALRHTCASRMANDLKMNTLIIAQQLGHRNIQTTNKYVHSKPEHMAKFAEKMSLGGSEIMTD